MGTPPAASRLGYAGLAPFFLCALLALFGTPVGSAVGQLCLLLYGGLILSFMGGCRWGFAAAGLGSGPSLAALGLSVAPSLWAFAVLGAAFAPFGPAGALAPFWAACAALILGFAGLLAADLSAARSGDAPTWWPSLRIPLTAGACAALGVAALGV